MRVPVLMYHRIAPCPPGTLVPGHYVSPALFRKHLTALKRRGHHTISLAQLLQGLRAGAALPSNPIVLTFDDGYQNFLTEAVPQLVEFGMTGTVFVVAGRLSAHNDWDHRLGDVRETLMSKDQVLECDRLGMEIGSHTMSHAHLTDIDLSAAEDEIRESKSRLEAVLSKEVSSFCYPYGEQNAAIQELVRRAGYRSACGTQRGLNDSQTDPYSWRRINVRRTTSTPHLFWKIARAARQL